MKLKIKSANALLISYFFTIAMIGSFLLQIPNAYTSGIPVPYIDALFTSVSAVCVTGLSTVDMSEYTRLGFIVIMALIEAGGLGIITFISIFTALPSKKVSLVNRRIIKDFFIDDVEKNPRKILISIVTFTLISQLCGTVLLSPMLYVHGSESYIFDSLFLSVSAFCNAGFSVYSDSMASFVDNTAINTVIMMLIILGGAGFIVLQNIGQTVSRKKARLTLHSKIVIAVSAVLIIGGAVLIFLCETIAKDSPFSFGPRVLSSFFQSVTSRTCGFETVPQRNFTPLVNLLTIFLMFIGGSPASMAGGIKTTTFFIAFYHSIKGTDEHGNLTVMHRSIESSTIVKAVTITTKCVMIVFVCVCLLTAAEHTSLSAGVFTMSDLLFESVSAFATVGLSLGITAKLCFWGKLIIICTMFIGRTGLFAMALHLPGVKDSSYLYEYPTESVLTG